MNRAAEEAQRKHMAAIEAREAQHRLRLEQQVVLVQARRRGQLGRRYASRRRNELKALYLLRRHAAAARIQAHWRARKEFAWVLGWHECAQTIQRMYRGKWVRKRHGTVREWVFGVRTGQRVWRGRDGRRAFWLALVARSALHLQVVARTVEPRSELQHRRCVVAAIVIQAHTRGMWGRRVAHFVWLGLRAAPFQALWRGYSYRLNRTRCFLKDEPVLRQILARVGLVRTRPSIAWAVHMNAGPDDAFATDAPLAVAGGAAALHRHAGQPCHRRSSAGRPCSPRLTLPCAPGRLGHATLC